MFVNLPLRQVSADSALLEMYFRKAIQPEIGLDSFGLDTLPAKWHRDFAARLADAGLACSVHLPFMDVRPASEDPLIRKASKDRLSKAMDVARIYGPDLMVGHPSLSEAYFEGSVERQRANSVETWGGLLGDWPEHPPLFLENTHDPDPDRIVALLTELDNPKIGVCFDVGHWHSFARGCERHDLGRWVEAFARFPMHLHLHDNNGSGDQHLGMGQGGIPWDQLSGFFDTYDLHPTATAEPHTPHAFEQTLVFLREHRLGRQIR
jgi:sugar phosphate isomerase/epimerase